MCDEQCSIWKTLCGYWSDMKSKLGNEWVCLPLGENFRSLELPSAWSYSAILISLIFDHEILLSERQKKNLQSGLCSLLCKVRFLLFFWWFYVFCYLSCLEKDGFPSGTPTVSVFTILCIFLDAYNFRSSVFVIYWILQYKTKWEFFFVE